VKVIGLAGFGGGKLSKMADVSFVVHSDEYAPVEDAHMILTHHHGLSLREVEETAFR